MQKENRGRKKKADPDCVAKPISVSLTKHEKDYLVKKFGSLRLAIKTLLPDEDNAVTDQIKPASLIKKANDREPTMAELFKQMIRQK